MHNPYSLVGKTILITGASSGIGMATAIECSKLGAQLIIQGRNTERLQKTFNSLEGNGHIQILGDLTEENELEKIISKLPKLDGVVYSIGTVLTIPTKMIYKDDITTVFDTNYNSIVIFNAKLLREKKLNKRSSLVFLSSVAANSYFKYGNAIYGSSKAAILAYSKVLALELSGRQIRVNSVLPAMVKTPFLDNFSIEKEQFEQDELDYPFGYGEPNDVAYAIIYLLSDAAKWVSGTELKLDGGFSLK